jgi:hypothetical protein
MSKRRYIALFIAIIIFLASAFIISFNWGMNKFTKDDNSKINNSNQITANVDNSSETLNSEQVVSPNAKVTLKIQYSKSGDIEERQTKVSDFAGKTKAALEEEGYFIESITSSELVLLKKVDSYSPNKYILGVKEECLAIYKTDAIGNMYIEDESTDVTDIEVPTKGDYDLLVKGSKQFQFNSKEEVEEKLGEYSS